MTNRTFGLLLLPLIPLSALGIVNLVNRALPTEPAGLECRTVEAPHRASPPPAPPAPAIPLSEKPA